VGVFGTAAWLTALSIYDARWRRLPNWLTLPGAVVVMVVAVSHGRGAAATIGAAALFGLYLAVHLISSTAMGAGDVKLAIGIGALTGAFGPEVWFVSTIGAALLTVLACVLLRRSAIPHGPAMCVAAGLAVALAARG
jgi:leader peptidase (prepilin peptidase) / N-methyltransferase